MINTAGLEDNRLQKYFYKLLVGFEQKMLKVAFEPAEQIPVRVLQ